MKRKRDASNAVDEKKRQEVVLFSNKIQSLTIDELKWNVSCDGLDNAK